MPMELDSLQQDICLFPQGQDRLHINHHQSLTVEYNVMAICALESLNHTMSLHNKLISVSMC